MGTFYAVQVMTGQETKTKDMLKRVLTTNGITSVKGIYANETHTQFVNNKSDSVTNGFEITEEDIFIYLKKDRMRSAITNRRLQLEVIENYYSPEIELLKKEYRKEISELEKKVRELSVEAKTIHSVLRGYILIEMTAESTILPAEIWHLIKNTPCVISILSRDPIPESEINHFFDNLSENLEPEVVLGFEKVKTYEEIEEEQIALLELLNKKDSKLSKSEVVSIENKLDNIHESVIDKVTSFLNNKPVDSILSKVKAFISRKQKMVSLPMALFNKIYAEAERSRIAKYIHEKDFIDRFDRLLQENNGSYI